MGKMWGKIFHNDVCFFEGPWRVIENFFFIFEVIKWTTENIKIYYIEVDFVFQNEPECIEILLFMRKNF